MFEQQQQQMLSSLGGSIQHSQDRLRQYHQSAILQ
jgi:hypothetical protein